MESIASTGTKSNPGAILPRRKRLARSRVTNGSDVLPNVDGRSEIARRFYDVVQAVIADQGGLEHLSEARLQLVRRFAASAVMAEQLEAELANGKPINIAEHAALSSTLVRLGQRIGLGRYARDVTPSTLRDYLEHRSFAAEVEP